MLLAWDGTWSQSLVSECKLSFEGENLRADSNAKDPLDHLLHPQEGQQDCHLEVAGMEMPAVEGFSL